MRERLFFNGRERERGGGKEERTGLESRALGRNQRQTFVPSKKKKKKREGHDIHFGPRPPLPSLFPRPLPSFYLAHNRVLAFMLNG